MKSVVEYSTKPADVKIMRRAADGAADVRMTQNFTPGTGEGADAKPGTAEEVYFTLALKDAPAADEVRANWQAWWAYGESWQPERDLSAEEALAQLRADVDYLLMLEG